MAVMKWLGLSVLGRPSCAAGLWLLGLAAAPALAADAAAARPEAPATASAPSSGAPVSAKAPAGGRAADVDASRDDRRVVEDDGVRIEERLVRGEVRHVSVQSKVAGARAYEVLVRRPGRDPSQDRSGAGHSVWPLLNF